MNLKDSTQLVLSGFYIFHIAGNDPTFKSKVQIKRRFLLLLCTQKRYIKYQSFSERCSHWDIHVKACIMNIVFHSHFTAAA